MKKNNRIVFMNMLSTVLLRGISFFSSPIFSRLLGTGGYGIVNTFSTWVGIFTNVGTLQTQSTIPNSRVEFPEDQRRYQSSIMGLSITVFLGCSVVVLILSPWLCRTIRISPWLLGLVWLQSFGSFAISFLNQKLNYELKAGRNMVVSVGTVLISMGLSLVLVLILPKEINYYGRILGNALTYGCLGIIVCVAVLIWGKTFWHPKYWKFAAVLAVPLALQGVADLLLGHFDLIMLRQMKGDDAAGLYGLAYNFAGIIFSIFVALNNSWTAFFFDQLAKRGTDKIYSQARNFMELFTILSMGFILLAPEVYHVFARQDFWDGTKLIPMFVAGYYLNFLCTFPVNYEYYRKKTNMVAAATIGASLVNIVVNYVMISVFGMIGAAVASLISRCLQFLLHYSYTQFVLGKKDYPFGVRLWGDWTMAFTACTAVVYLLPNMALVRWGLGAALGIFELFRVRKRKVLI